jgi:hypothetical protein
VCLSGLVTVFDRARRLASTPVLLAAEWGDRLELYACMPDAVAAVEALPVLVAARFQEIVSEREHYS